jgi:methylated-DNA-[protein]-cysteine S-methyltransferase
MRRTAASQADQFLLFECPIGWLGIVAGPQGLVEIVSRPRKEEVRRHIAGRYPGARETGEGCCTEAAQQIADYFAGRRRDFDLPLDLSGLSDFTRTVLETLRHVPVGSTVSYGQLARRAGRPGAARAVGGAMAGNPLPIVIPCHRVIGSGGRLVGYSGGRGVETKEWLLEFERGQAG